MSEFIPPPKPPKTYKTAAERLREQEQKIANLRDEVSKEVGRAREIARNRDTRLKILLGGALISFLRDDKTREETRQNLTQRLKERFSPRDLSEYSSDIDALQPPAKPPSKQEP